MKYAVVKTGGKQYKVAPGQVLQVEKLDSDGKNVVFSEVLLVADGDNVQLGTPTVEGVKVFGSVVAEVKGEKIEVFKYKSKSRYRKHTGHRQQYTQVKIDSIGAKPASPSASLGGSEANAEPKAEKVAKVAAPKKVAAKKPAAKKAAAK